MEQLSFIEKLGVLFQNILAHPFFICILLVPVLLIFFNKKITKKAIVLIYIGILAIVLFIGGTTIFALFDNLVDGIFMALYFPNFITLFLVELLSAIICLITFIKKDITKTSKIINITAFTIIQMLFALILTVIQSNDIDIYKENALYANSDVLTLMQLLMGTFALQLITLLVIKAINKVTDKLDGKTQPSSHQIKLPEGRITHAKLSDKIIIKEPEVKLDEAPKIKPLDKSLIEEIKISPLDVNEEIIKDKNKPKQFIKVNPPKEEIKLEKMPDIKPLDKSLIEETKINPLDINEEIIKDKNKPKEQIKQVKIPENKPLDKSLIENYEISPIDINEEIIKEKKQKDTTPVPEIIEENVKTIDKVIIPQPKEEKTIETKPIKEPVINQKEIKEETYKEKINPVDEIFKHAKEQKPQENPFANFKMEFPEDTTPKVKQPDKVPALFKQPEFIPIKPVEELTIETKPVVKKETPKIEQPDYSFNLSNQIADSATPAEPVEAPVEAPKVPTKPVEPAVEQTPIEPVQTPAEAPATKPVIEPTLVETQTVEPAPEVAPVEPETTEEEKELIANLEIIDYEKTVKALKNLSTVYTL